MRSRHRKKRRKRRKKKTKKRKKKRKRRKKRKKRNTNQKISGDPAQTNESSKKTANMKTTHPSDL